MADMVLWTSPASPYARLIMMAAHELNAVADLDCREVTPDTIIDAVSPANSLAQIPTLVLADGAAVYDSRTILYCLDDRYGPQLIPREPDAHAAVMTRFALSNGLIDAANLRRNLDRQPEGQRPDGLVKRLATRIGRALDALETACGAFGEAFQADQIAAVMALGYLDYRFAEEDWRGGRPALAAWYGDVGARPSVAATAHPAG
jgi:glutathione S-transferase